MSWNGSGTFTPARTFVADKAAGAPTNIVTASLVDQVISDIADGLEHCQTVNGETAITANLPMATFRHTGVGNAAARNDYAAAGQVQDGGLVYAASSGTDTLTLTLSPAITAYAAGQRFTFKAGGTNTGATTLNVNSVGAKAIQKNLVALVAGDITANDIVEVVYDGTQFQMTSPARTPVLTGTVLANVVEDTTPQLGGMLDVNGNAIGDGTLELLTFTETASAVNQVNITNAATGDGPILSPAGGDTDVPLNLVGKGTGQVQIGAAALKFPDSDGSAGQFMKTDGAGALSFDDASGGVLTLAGTAQVFTGIPADVNHVIVIAENLDSVTNSDILVQIGDSGGLETTGYVSVAAVIPDGASPTNSPSTTGFLVKVGMDGGGGTFVMHLVRQGTTNEWVASFSGIREPGTRAVLCGGGRKTLSAALDRISVIISAGSFSGGNSSCWYEAP